MIKSLFQLLLLFLLSSIACKADPQWWTYSQTSIWSGSPQTTGNKAPIVAGQLKHVANQAKKYLDGTVASAGGAGSRIDDLINDFGSVDNTAIVNIGQLRHVAGVFYERLWDLGFSAKDYLIANQGLHPDFFFGVSGPFYPWNELSTDYGIATIGQLKLCFSFDLGSYGSVTDTDNDGLPDWWESNYFGNLLKNATGDDDGDGATNGAEYQGNFVPTDSDTDGDGVSDGIEASDGGDENYQRVTIKVTTPSDRDVVVYHNTVEARTFSPPGEVDVFFKESVDDHTIFIATDPKPGDPPGGIPYSVEIVPWAGGTQVAEAFTRWIFNSSVSASIPSGNFNLSHNASWEFNDVSVEIVEEAGKGSGVFVPLNNHFPVYVDATTMSFNSSYAYTGGSYEVVFADIPSGSTTDSVDIIFEDVSGSASHTLTETSNNSGVFQNGTIVLTVSPVPSFTDDEADEITAVISGVLGFTSASMNFDETLRNSLRFVQERPDVSVVLPTGLRAGSIDTAEVMVDVDGGVQSDTFTETSVSSRLFTNTSTRYCNIANPTTLSSSIADTLTVELGLGDRDISLRVDVDPDNVTRG